jgi:hypothetical protein
MSHDLTPELFNSLVGRYDMRVINRPGSNEIELRTWIKNRDHMVVTFLSMGLPIRKFRWYRDNDNYIHVLLDNPFLAEED